MRIPKILMTSCASFTVLAACETSTVGDVPASGARSGVDSVTASETRVEPEPDVAFAEIEPAPMRLMSPMADAISGFEPEVVIEDSLRADEKIEKPVQSGLLTAGDYDDVLNPGLYKAYLDKVLQGALGKKDLPFIDANNRIEIEVIDTLGKPVPLADLTVYTGAGQKAFPLKTGVNGKAYVFPNYDRLSSDMTIGARPNTGEEIEAELSPDLLETGGTLTFVFDQDRAMPQQLDLLLTLDATGSMRDEMAYLQAELVAILDRVRDSQPELDIRLGFIVYRDRGDAYVVRDYDFTDDLDEFKQALSKQSAQGGGDTPEAIHDALARGLEFEWREDAVKINLLVADAPPHDEHLEATWTSGLISRSKGIHIVSMAASGVDDTAEFMMRGLSQLTNARYLFLTDDSGIGLAHAEPTVDCYVVTRLDQLVERVMVSLITGERVEPEGADVIRTVGNYRNGICVVEDSQSS
ncbi:MAG: vWA domain-containing protein [Pseudomonadota bacterium]